MYLSYNFLETFGIPIELGAMFTIAEYLIELVALEPANRRAQYLAHERSDTQEEQP